MLKKIESNYKKRVLYLSGDITQRNAHLVQKIIMENITDSIKELQIDMKDVHYLDSTGIGIFILISRKMKEKNGNLSFRNLKKNIIEVLKLSGLDDFFSVKQ
jgi:anti-sigma B factor antagonist